MTFTSTVPEWWRWAEALGRAVFVKDLLDATDDLFDDYRDREEDHYED